MRITKAEFITSVVNEIDLPNDDLPQVCVVGRSNVGKSSFINLITGYNKLAKVSSTPGRTRMINFFKINDGLFYLVDLPGYGYQQGSKEQTKKWGSLIEKYLTNTQALKQVIMIVDIRHEPTSLDKEMANYLYYNQLPFSIFASKSDKLSRAQINKQISVIAASLRVGRDNIIPFSSVSGHNKDLLVKHLIEKALGTIEQAEDNT